jgi:predicted small secreted protein
MRINHANRLGAIVAVAFCVVTVTGCNDKSQLGQSMEKAGAAVEEARAKMQ